MNDAIRHYDQLLAEHYSWMVGIPFEEKVAEQAALLRELGLSEGRHGIAIEDFVAAYDTEIVQPYPGVAEVVERLGRWAVCIAASSKSERCILHS